MDSGTRQNHIGLCLFTYLIRVSPTCVFSVLLSFKFAAWHKVKPNTDLKIQAQEYANSLWGVAQNHPRSQKCVRRLKIDLVQAPFKTCLASHSDAWKLKKCVSCLRVVKIRLCSKVLFFYIVWGASQTALAVFPESYWHESNPMWPIPMNVSHFTTSERFQDDEYATRIRREHQKWKYGHSFWGDVNHVPITAQSGGDQHRSR